MTTTSLSLLAAATLALCACSHDAHAPAAAAAASTTARVTTEPFEAEAACGACQLGLPGDGCDLAVRFDGRAYYVDGAKIDQHGDAHAADGFCNAVRKARVSGQIAGERFTVASFELLPAGQ